MFACGWMLILFQVYMIYSKILCMSTQKYPTDFNGTCSRSQEICWALKGPKTVTGATGGSVSVQCQYSSGYEESVKYWCKETGHRQCDHHIRTAGSEEEVKQNRISIQDSHALHIFKVTMENLTDGDAGTYLCGVEKAGRFDIWYPVEVKVTADFPSSNQFENKEKAAEETSTPGSTTTAFERTQSSNSVMFLVFKITIFLAMVVAVVCVHIWHRRGRGTNAKIPAT